MQAISDQILAARSVLLVTHVDPDGDAIGSLLGMGWLLRAQGKMVTLACQDPVPDLVAWLPGAGEIERRGSEATLDGEVAPEQGHYDLVICLDCSDYGRMGAAYEGRLAVLPLCNIDHHITNTHFGSVNWVDPTCVATAQMVLVLAESLGWPIGPEAATCLLTGIVTDTRGFRTANVDATALRAGLRLVEAGAPLAEIARLALDGRPLAAVRLWGEAIGGLRLEDGILWTEVTREMRERWSLGEDGATGLINFLSGVREAKVVAVLAERDNGTVDVGLRSVAGIDVAQIAQRLGGGGHPQAAGCTLVGGLAEVRERVLEELRRLGDGCSWTVGGAGDGCRVALTVHTG